MCEGQIYKRSTGSKDKTVATGIDNEWKQLLIAQKISKATAQFKKRLAKTAKLSRADVECPLCKSMLSILIEGKVLSATNPK
jgi:hypothetical protein